MSNDKSAGMDGGFLNTFGGGDFEMTICSLNGNCCNTGNLNTEVNNWERGQQNFFVGRQLGNCENFDLVAGSDKLSITIQHSGSDGGKIDWIKLRGSDMKRNVVHCPVGRSISFFLHVVTKKTAEFLPSLPGIWSQLSLPFLSP